MMRFILPGALFFAVIAAGSQPARADDHAPWCAVLSYGGGDVVWDCQYRTVEECVPNALLGNLGFCNHNPRYEPPLAGPKAHAKRHVRRD
jgi:hypothetical protein